MTTLYKQKLRIYHQFGIRRKKTLLEDESFLLQILFVVFKSTATFHMYSHYYLLEDEETVNIHTYVYDDCFF